MRTILTVVLFSLPMLAADRAWDTAAVRAACGPNEVKFNANPSRGQQPATPAEAGKALVYVVEPYGPVNRLGIPTIRVGLDGSWAGANHASYLFFSVQPGEHHLCADWQSALYVQPSLINLRAEAGQTYYFSTLITAHPGFYTVEFAPQDSDEGRLLLETSSLSDYHPKK